MLAIDATPYFPTPFITPPRLHYIQSQKKAPENTIIVGSAIIRTYVFAPYISMILERLRITELQTSDAIANVNTKKIKVFYTESFG